MKPNFTDEELLNEIKHHLEIKNKAINELDKLNIALIRINNQLTNAEALKTNFLANIRNELFNPLTSILAITRNILNDDSEKIDYNEIKKLIEYIYVESFYLNFQLTNIVLAATIEAGDLNLQISNFDLVSLTNSIIEEFKYFTNKKNLWVTFEFNNNPLNINSDIEKIKIIIANLIDNAIKFTYENEKILIKLTKIEEDTNEFSIINFGKGILEENIDKVYDRFWKEDNTINSINKGLGLGLSITKALIELIGGKIEIRSIAGLETEVKLIIPNINKKNIENVFDLNAYIF